MKIFYIVLDGAADWKIKELDGKTPLQAAKTPFLEDLVMNGEQSEIEILPNKMVPETDSGLMSLLGYDPLKYYCGRGTLEALGLNLHKNSRFYAGFRINFASINQREGILDRRTSRDLSKDDLFFLTQEIKEKVSLIGYPDIGFDLISFGNHRGILCFFSNTTKLSGNVSNTDPCFQKKGYFSEPSPFYDNKIRKCVPLDTENASAITAEILNEFTKQCLIILKDSVVNKRRISQGKEPANCIIARDGGRTPFKMPSFYRRYHKTIAIYGGLPCEKALAKLIGGKFFYSKALELQLDRQYLSELSKDLLKGREDVKFCHLKGPDEPGHEHDPIGKIKAIELIDHYFLGNIVHEKNADDIVIVTCDHMTPCELGLHSGDKVPLLISGGKMQVDNTTHFDEYNACKGKCKVQSGTDILDYVIGRYLNE